MSDKLLAVRVDASANIGTGHLMRCIALAQAWQDLGGAVQFVCREIPSKLRDRVIDEGFDVSDLSAKPASEADMRETAKVVKTRRASALVVDGYLFRDSYLNALREELGSMPILLVDDWGQSESMPVSLVLNQNPPPWPKHYNPNEVVALLGTDYALLRREFLEATREGGERDQILVTFGGSDVLGLGPSVAAALADCGPVTVVIGAAANTHAELCELAKLRRNITVLSDVKDMPAVMKRTKIAVSAAGSTSWELCYFGIPTVSVPVARNQQPIAEFLDVAGAAIALTVADDIAVRCGQCVAEILEDRALREGLTRRAMELVDGRGAERVVHKLLECCVI